jgi:hypothetical protein
MLANPDIGVTQIAHRLRVSPATLYRHLRPFLLRGLCAGYEPDEFRWPIASFYSVPAPGTSHGRYGCSAGVITA